MLRLNKKHGACFLFPKQESVRVSGKRLPEFEPLRKSLNHLGEQGKWNGPANYPGLFLNGAISDPESGVGGKSKQVSSIWSMSLKTGDRDRKGD